jgi:hypothetical protein
MAEVRFELAKEEMKNIDSGILSVTAPHVFLYDGLQLEEQQCVSESQKIELVLT